MKTKYDLSTQREHLFVRPGDSLSPKHCEQLDHVGRGRSLEWRTDIIDNMPIIADRSSKKLTIRAGSFAELSGAAVSMPAPKKLPELCPLEGPTSLPRVLEKRWVTRTSEMEAEAHSAAEPDIQYTKETYVSLFLPLRGFNTKLRALLSDYPRS